MCKVVRLLNENIILTAAHCAILYPKYVRVGHSDYQSEKVKKYKISEVLIHPEFKCYNQHNINDIALLKLEKNLTFDKTIQPIQLPREDFSFNTVDKENTTILLAGWGRITEWIRLTLFF